MIALDYTIKSPEERTEFVKQIIDENPDLSEKYLEVLANYILYESEAQEKKKKILTSNRMITVNSHETSFEGLASQLENGEDGIYPLINESKSTIMRPPVERISKKDLEQIPFLSQIQEAISFWETKLKSASGRSAYIIKSAILELRKEQYIVRNAYRRPIKLARAVGGAKTPIKLNSSFTFKPNGYLLPLGVSLCNPKVISAILCNYSRLKEEGYGNFEGDLYYLITDFDALCEKALAEHPLYEAIVTYKIDGLSNIDIQSQLKLQFGITHSLEYISSLWRNKIPRLIASVAEDQELDNYYLNIEKGTYKKCSRCGAIKLAHNKYFSRNSTSKDGFYSICKECRNARKEE